MPAPTISAMPATTPSISLAATWRPTSLAIAARWTCSGSPSRAEAARRMAPPIIAKGEPAARESPRPKSMRAGAAPRRRRSSWRRRDLPAPGAPVTSATRARESASASRKRASSEASSRSRPTHGVALPRSVRGGVDVAGASEIGGAVKTRASPASITSNSSPRRRAVAASMWTSPGRARSSSAAPRSMTSPVSPPSPAMTARPVPIATRAPRNAWTSESAARAARRTSSPRDR